MKDICVIVPTIRDYKIIGNYVENAKRNNFDADRLNFILVTEDFCETDKMKTFLKENSVKGEVFDNKKRLEWFEERNLKNFSDVIPNKSHAETSFGLLWMLENGFEYGVFIDDDTLPHQNDHFGMHINNLNFSGNIKLVSSDKNWVNVLHENFKRHALYPRGYPYSKMNEKNSIKNADIKNVVISQGLWVNIPDLDAVRILMGGDLNGQSNVLTEVSDFQENFIVDKNNYLTISSMNLAFRKEIIPAFYQLPMDDNQWKIGRFDDIWSGILIKKACDILGKNIINGSPLCIHNKAPRNTFKDLNVEVPALDINEKLWEIIDKVEISSKNYFDIYQSIAECLKNEKGILINGEFLPYMAEKMSRWLKCLDRLGL